MTRENENDLKLGWAAGKIRKAQDENAFCAITIHIKDGVIYKLERNDSFLPPTPGALTRQTGG